MRGHIYLPALGSDILNNWLNKWPIADSYFSSFNTMLDIAKPENLIMNSINLIYLSRVVMATVLACSNLHCGEKKTRLRLVNLSGITTAHIAIGLNIPQIFH